MPHSPSARALAALMLLAVIWGYNWVVMKEVMRYVDPFDFTRLRPSQLLPSQRNNHRYIHSLLT